MVTLGKQHAVYIPRRWTSTAGLAHLGIYTVDDVMTEGGAGPQLRQPRALKTGSATPLAWPSTRGGRHHRGRAHDGLMSINHVRDRPGATGRCRGGSGLLYMYIVAMGQRRPRRPGEPAGVSPYKPQRGGLKVLSIPGGFAGGPDVVPGRPGAGPPATPAFRTGISFDRRRSLLVRGSQNALEGPVPPGSRGPWPRWRNQRASPPAPTPLPGEMRRASAASRSPRTTPPAARQAVALRAG